MSLAYINFPEDVLGISLQYKLRRIGANNPRRIHEINWILLDILAEFFGYSN